MFIVSTFKQYIADILVFGFQGFKTVYILIIVDFFSKYLCQCFPTKILVII